MELVKEITIKRYNKKRLSIETASKFDIIFLERKLMRS